MIYLIYVNYWLIVFIFELRIQVYQISKEHNFVVFDKLVNYAPFFWAVFQTHESVFPQLAWMKFARLATLVSFVHKEY